MKRALLGLAILLALSATARADAQAVVKQQLAEGEKRYAEQDYRAAIETFNAIIADSASTRDQRARAYEYIGMSWLILGKKARAKEAFEDLLSIDPNYTLTDPSRSPKLREFFETVRMRFVPGSGHTDEADLEHSAPSGAVAGRPIEMSAQATRNAEAVAKVTMHARRQGLLDFSATAMRGPDASGRFQLNYTPPREASDYNLEFYLEARDPKGRVVARVASPEKPIVLPVKGAPLPPVAWYKRWYVWAAVGAVVGAAVIAGAVAGSAQKAPDGTLGKVSLGLRF